MPENRKTPQTTPGLPGKLQTTSHHCRTARKTAGHTTEQGGSGSKTVEQQCMLYYCRR